MTSARRNHSKMRETDRRRDVGMLISARVLMGTFDCIPRRAALARAENEFHFQDGEWYPDSVSAMLQKRIDDQPTLSRQMVREAEEILHRHLKGVGLKQTAQRDAILRTFLETRDHLSTDELHRLVQKKDARIGYTTVYRTLKLLAECGLASEVAFHDGIARYEHQYNRRSHHHMVCTDCGSSVEFFSQEVGQLEQEIGRKYRYLTTRHTFQIYGVCEDCRKKNHVPRPL
jgi:Fur family transcriptional regulator, ferric uptake regulator